VRQGAASDGRDEPGQDVETKFSYQRGLLSDSSWPALVPAIGSGKVPQRMAGTSPAKTAEKLETAA
jgi:hypothetical protein